MNEASITIEDAENGIKIAKISGQLDESNVDEKIQDLYKVIEATPKGLKLLLDLENLEYMNSKSIGYLTDLYGKITENGGKVAIAKAKPNIIDILQVVGLTQLINSYDTTEEAKAALAGGGAPAAPKTAQPEAPKTPAAETPAVPATETPKAPAAAPVQPETPTPPAPPAETPAKAPSQPETPAAPAPEAPKAPEAPTATPEKLAETKAAPAPKPTQPTPDISVKPSAPAQPEAPASAPTQPETPAKPAPEAPVPQTPKEEEGTYKFEK